MGIRPIWLWIILILPGFLEAEAQDRSVPPVHITLAEKNRSIQQTLEEISLQSGFQFTYDANLVKGSEKIRFGVEELELQECLDSLLRNPELAYRVIGRNIVIYRINRLAPVPISDSIQRSILRGRVVDGRTGKALPFATLALHGTNRGGITNQEGGFSFKIPITLGDPLLVVSYMGYKNRMVPLTYPLDEDLIIEMERQLLPLQEVIIRHVDPERLLNEAIKKIPANYADEHATMTAFYRESVRRNDHCMLYSEAVVDIAKTPYGSSLGTDQVRIRRGRKISDVHNEDTVLIKLRSGLHSSLSLDVVKQRTDFLQADFAEHYILEFVDIMTYGDRLVYVISFHQRPHINDLLFTGKLYIDNLSLAIIAADFEFNPELIQRYPEVFLVSSSPRIRIRPLYARYHVDYQGEEGQYHLGQVRAEMALKIRRRRHWAASRYNLSLEMAVTHNKPGERLRIPNNERVRDNMVLSDTNFPFDPLFWGVYNIIEPEATLMESISRLESQLRSSDEEISLPE